MPTGYFTGIVLIIEWHASLILMDGISETSDTRPATKMLLAASVYESHLFLLI